MPARLAFVSRWLSQPGELFLQTPMKRNTSRPLSLPGAMAISPRSAARPLNIWNRSVSTFRTSRPQGKFPRWTTSNQFASNRMRQAFQRFNSSKAGNSEPASFSQRMRKLSREYGWAALGVYLLLSALDFPFCFAAVRLLGVERIGYYEHVIFESVMGVIGSVFPFPESKEAEPEDGRGGEGEADKTESKKPGEEASIWTQIALAYALHKSLIFFRVPLTAAVTPNVVKTLRRWGVDIGKRRPGRT